MELSAPATISYGVPFVRLNLQFQAPKRLGLKRSMLNVPANSNTNNQKLWSLISSQQVMIPCLSTTKPKVGNWQGPKLKKTKEKLLWKRRHLIQLCRSSRSTWRLLPADSSDFDTEESRIEWERRQYGDPTPADIEQPDKDNVIAGCWIMRRFLHDDFRVLETNSYWAGQATPTLYKYQFLVRAIKSGTLA